MKLLDVDWESVLRGLAVWQALPVPARRVLTDLKTHGYAPSAQVEPFLDLFAANGLLSSNPKGTLVSVREDRRELVKVLRAMRRHPVFEDPSLPQIHHYLEQHFSNNEMQAFGGLIQGFNFAVNRVTLAPRITSTRWVEELLEARTRHTQTAWMSAHGLDSNRLFARGVDVVKDLQTVVGELAPSPHGVPLREFIARPPIAALTDFANTLHAGLTSLVLFAGMRTADLEPMIGLWPTVAQEISRPPAQAPAAVVADVQFGFAIAMEDMTTLLAEIVASPVRLRSADLLIFARARAEIERRLVAIPPWAEPMFLDQRLSRLDHAAHALQASGLAAVQDRFNNPHLESTPAASHWLAKSAHDRLATLADPVRNAKDVNPGRYYDAYGEPKFFPYTFPWAQAPKALRVREALTSAFLTARADFLSLDQFLDYGEREANPLLAGVSGNLDPYGLGAYSGGGARDTSRQVWRSALTQFLYIRLLPLGGAILGRTTGGALCFRLTDVGRYLLGDVPSFEYGSGPAGEVVVQPNFDVVFLGTDPSAESTIARFAERVGAPPGLAFKITRASVLAAAESGMAVADVIGTLAQASTKPIPKNVEREIAGWMSAVRRATLREIEVIECADEEAAGRVVSVLGTKARRLTPTIFELPAMTSAVRAATTKKLRAAGVFLDVVKAPAPVAKKRAARRYDEDWEDDLI